MEDSMAKKSIEAAEAKPARKTVGRKKRRKSRINEASQWTLRRSVVELRGPFQPPLSRTLSSSFVNCFKLAVDNQSGV
jgi:hypothetical protein